MKDRRVREMLRFAAAATLVSGVVSLGVAGAQGEQSPDPSDFPPGSDQAQAGPVDGPYKDVDGIGPARLTEEGLLEVKLADGVEIVHGSDPGPAIEPPDDASADTAAAQGINLDNPLCTDNPLLFRVVYAHPENKTSARDEVATDIRTAMRWANYTVHRDGLAYSGDDIKVDMRVKCTPGGAIDVAGFKANNITSSSSNEDFDTISNQAAVHDFDAPGRRYIIFWDSHVAGACGIGSFRSDDSRSVNNVANDGSAARYSVIYGRACWGGGRTPLHEAGHNMGAVQYSAPHNSDGAHCNHQLDVMCYFAGDAANYPQLCNIQRFDCNGDDYFDPNASTGYLSTKWNLGWNGNKALYIRP